MEIKGKGSTINGERLEGRFPFDLSNREIGRKGKKETVETEVKWEKKGRERTEIKRRKCKGRRNDLSMVLIQTD